MKRSSLDFSHFLLSNIFEFLFFPFFYFTVLKNIFYYFFIIANFFLLLICFCPLSTLFEENVTTTNDEKPHKAQKKLGSYNFFSNNDNVRKLFFVLSKPFMYNFLLSLLSGVNVSKEKEKKGKIVWVLLPLLYNLSINLLLKVFK